MGQYVEEMKNAMEWLAQQPDTLFLGQAVASPGTFMHATLERVPHEKRLEMPVCESFQMQVSVGLALDDVVPVSIYPRQNFLLLATGDLSNLVDKIEDMTSGAVRLPLIIRTAAGTTKPLDPGHQHVGNFAEAFRRLFANIEVVELHQPDEILPAYQKAYRERKPTLLIEFGDHYQDR